MRNATLSWVSMALAVAFSLPAAEAAFADTSADGSPPDASPARTNPTTGGGGGGGGGSTQGKIIRNPDDSSTPDFPASSRLVRDIVATRPNEDLIICIAGCRPGQDRVIYAQPLDRQALPKPAPVSEFEQKDAPKPEAAAAAAPSPTAPADDKKNAEAVVVPVIGPVMVPVIGAVPGAAASDDKKVATPAEPAAAAGPHSGEMPVPAQASDVKPADDVKSEMVPTSSGDAMKDAAATMKSIRFGSPMHSHVPATAKPPEPAAKAH